MSLPPARGRLDLLDDIDPDAGQVEQAKAPLAERLVPQRQGYGRPALLESSVLGAGIGDLELEADPLAAEALRARRRRARGA